VRELGELRRAGKSPQEIADHLGTTYAAVCTAAYKKGLSKRLRHSRRPEYAIFRGLINRCENPKVRSYPIYGGRGIRVAPEWRTNFAAFFEHVGLRPSPAHSIERVDVNGHYEPGNVVWATPVEQANNTRRTRYVTYRGKRMSLCNAVRAAGSVIHREAAWVRIRTGWDVATALETPRLHLSGNAREHRQGAELIRGLRRYT